MLFSKLVALIHEKTRLSDALLRIVVLLDAVDINMKSHEAGETLLAQQALELDVAGHDLFGCNQARPKLVRQIGYLL